MLKLEKYYQYRSSRLKYVLRKRLRMIQDHSTYILPYNNVLIDDLTDLINSFALHPLVHYFDFVRDCEYINSNVWIHEIGCLTVLDN